VRVSGFVVEHYKHTQVWKELGGVDGKDGGVGKHAFTNEWMDVR
jgi:hypothetical protein